MWLEYVLVVLVLALLWSFRGEGKVKRKVVFAPSRMFLFGWLLVLLCMASGMITFHESMHLVTFILLLGSITAFVAGARLANRSSSEDRKDRPDSRLSPDALFLAVMSTLSILGIVGLFGDFASGNVTRLLQDPSTLSIVRTERWDSFYSEESGLSVLDSLGMAGCMTIAALLPHFIKQRRIFWSCFSLVSAVAVTVYSLLSAGRFTIGVLVLVLIIGSALSREKRGLQRLFTLPRIAVAVVVGYYFFVIFPVQRNPALPTAVEAHLGWASNAHLPDWVKDVAAQEGLSSFSVFAYSTGYFSRALDKLNYFIVHTDIANSYLLGQYNLPQMSKVVGTFSASESGWYKARIDIAALMHAQGWSPNPWATGVRDLVIDFGLLGAIICTFIFGYVAQRIFNSALEAPSYMVNVAAAYVSASSFIFAFIGPSQIRVITTPLILIGVLFVLTRQPRRSVIKDRAVGRPEFELSN